MSNPQFSKNIQMNMKFRLGFGLLSGNLVSTVHDITITIPLTTFSEWQNVNRSSKAKRLDLHMSFGFLFAVFFLSCCFVLFIQFLIFGSRLVDELQLLTKLEYTDMFAQQFQFQFIRSFVLLHRNWITRCFLPLCWGFGAVLTRWTPNWTLYDDFTEFSQFLLCTQKKYIYKLTFGTFFPLFLSLRQAAQSMVLLIRFGMIYTRLHLIFNPIAWLRWLKCWKQKNRHRWKIIIL